MNTFLKESTWRFITVMTTLSLFIYMVFPAGNVQAASIAFDASATANTVFNASSVSWSHTIGAGSNEILMVGINYGTGGSVTISNVTYNSVAMTQISSNSPQSSGTGRTALYFMKNPPAGAHTVAVTFSGATRGGPAGSISFSGVDQVTTFGASTGSVKGTGTNGSAQSVFDSVTTTVDSSWLVDVAGNIDGTNVSTTYTVGSGQTKTFDSGTGDASDNFFYGGMMSYKGPVSPTASTSMSATISGATSARNAHIVIELLPANTGPTPPPPVQATFNGQIQATFTGNQTVIIN